MLNGKNRISVETGRIDAILMASGLSRRFGASNKLLAPFLGKPLVQYALELACGFSGLSRVILVAAHPQVLRLGGGFPCTVLQNRNPQRGAVESVRLGVLASQADYYLFLPCDQPLLTEELLSHILALRKPGYIVEPRFAGTAGSPSLFSAAFREALIALEEGENPRMIKKRNVDRLLPAHWASPLPFWDVDTPQDLAEMEAFCTKEMRQSVQENENSKKYFFDLNDC